MSLRFIMNDSEMRRRELLRQTRKLYDDRRDIPAVHPRYGRIYHDLYKNGDEEQNAGDTDSEAGRIDYKRQGSLANPVYDADQGIVSV